MPIHKLKHLIKGMVEENDKNKKKRMFVCTKLLMVTEYRPVISMPSSSKTKSPSSRMLAEDGMRRSEDIKMPIIVSENKTYRTMRPGFLRMKVLDTISNIIQY